MNNNAEQIIIKMIVNKVYVMNLYKDQVSADSYNDELNELRGMLICLKNIRQDDKFYTLQFSGWDPDHKEINQGVIFGYYDSEGRFFHI